MDSNVAKKYMIATKTIFEIDSNEFDRMVRENVPNMQNYECVPDEEWNNDSDHSTSITPDWAEKYFLSTFENLDNGNTVSVNWKFLLAYLAHKEIIPYGNWVISVSW